MRAQLHCQDTSTLQLTVLASACSTKLLESVDELQRQSDEQQMARRMYCPRGLGSPEQLQDLVRGVTLEQIHIVMQALENEHEYL